MDAMRVGRPTIARLSRLSPEKNDGHYCLPKSGWVADSLLESNGWFSSYAPLLESKVELPRAKFVEVPHIRQLSTWDCGLACVLMVLKSLGIEDCDMKSLERLCNTKSIWTVDLAHLLRKFSVNVLFLTVTIGANPSFVCESFYKEHMAEDRERVNQLFEKAPEAGIQIQVLLTCIFGNDILVIAEDKVTEYEFSKKWRSISGGELSKLILSGNYVAIALVDKYKLSQPWLEEFCLTDCYGVNSGYTGHYVVICGYDMDAKEFEIRDPASSRKSERVSLERLDEARKSFGTDEDILLISLDKSNGEAGSNCAD